MSGTLHADVLHSFSCPSAPKQCLPHIKQHEKKHEQPGRLEPVSVPTAITRLCGQTLGTGLLSLLATDLHAGPVALAWLVR